jgi:transposase
MKLTLVVEAGGLPIGMVTAAADVHETQLAEPALASIPAAVELPPDVPVIADRGFDSDPLRDDLAEGGHRLLAPHRQNRKRPSRNDGRRIRRYRRRYIVERTIGWLHSYRRVMVRQEWWPHLHMGFVHLACTFIALSRL